jgi:ketosteroid isomerase-like protein
MRPNRVIIASILAATCLALLSFAEQKPDISGKITALESKWCDAYKQRDVAAMSALLADDFIITVEDGNAYGKAGYIAHSGDANTQVEVSEMIELKVRVRGNVAIVTGAYHEKGKTRGKSYEYHDRLTDTWINSEGKWLVLASHYSIPAK